MRILLFTGKGGVGKTTTAAASAVHAARRGTKTLLMSADPAHSLADAFGVTLGSEPTEVGHGLSVLQIDTQRRFESAWGSVQTYLRQLFAGAGADPLTADEIAVLPGAEEVMALLELRARAEAGIWELIIVDCAPTAETLRLLALPELLSWYAERLFPKHSRVLLQLRAIANRARDLPAPGEEALSAFSALVEDLAAVQRLLADPDRTSVRLVLTPESVGVAEARRTYSSLRLYGYHVDGVVVNRLVPSGGGDPWRDAWVAAQHEQLLVVQESFSGVALRTVPYQLSEPVGLESLADLGEQLYDADDPIAGSSPADYPRIDRVPADVTGGTMFILALDLPHLDKTEVDLARSGDDLVVTAGGRRRYVGLSSALRRCVIVGAEYAEGELRIRFVPDPDLWPKS